MLLHWVVRKVLLLTFLSLFVVSCQMSSKDTVKKDQSFDKIIPSVYLEKDEMRPNFDLKKDEMVLPSEKFITHTKYRVKKGDSFNKIAQSFDLGKDEIMRANPHITNIKNITAGKEIILPTSHLAPDAKMEGIVINLAEPRLYFFSKNEKFSFPISVGADEATPLGKTKVIARRENPVWTPPASIREENPNLGEVVLAGPDNPLGKHALYLDASNHFKWQSILIHGTNAPQSIGSKVSHGCIRLYPKDIKLLFDTVENNAPVEIVDQPIKVSEINGKVYIEVHFKEAPDVVMESLGASKVICKKIKDCESRIDWHKADEAVVAGLGIPVEISR